MARNKQTTHKRIYGPPHQFRKTARKSTHGPPHPIQHLQEEPQQVPEFVVIENVHISDRCSEYYEGGWEDTDT